MIQIREIQKSDNAALATVIREVFEEFDAPRMGTVYSDPTTDNLFEQFQTSKGILWVATDNNVVVGCCGVYPTSGLPDGYVELVKFYIAKNARGMGIGKLLMTKSVDAALELGYKSLYLESLPEFSKAVGIYKKLGFTMLDSRLGESGHTSCNIWMSKVI